jgi:hypothetical protein
LRHNCAIISRWRVVVGTSLRTTVRMTPTPIRIRASLPLIVTDWMSGVYSASPAAKTARYDSRPIRGFTDVLQKPAAVSASFFVCAS